MSFVVNKTPKLLLSDNVSLMFSQPENRLNLRAIMDEGKVLLINLAGLDGSIKSVLGCFTLALLHMSVISRSDTAAPLMRAFHIHCDEAHQFITDTLESLISETRKFGASLTLVHQYLSQFGKKKNRCLVNRDANYLAKRPPGQGCPVRPRGA